MTMQQLSTTTTHTSTFTADITINYSIGHAKAAARHTMWSSFLLGHKTCQFRVQESLDLYRSEGDQWLSLVWGAQGLDFWLEGVPLQPGEVVILPKIHISEIPPEDYIPEVLSRLLKRVHFCTREEAILLRAAHEAEVEEAIANGDSRLPEPPALVAVEDLQGGEALMAADAALR